VYRFVRWARIFYYVITYWFCRRFPQVARRALLEPVRKMFPSQVHNFSPKYNPWDQRVCACPDGDFFEAVKNGTASIITDEIKTFSEQGIELRSGHSLPADVIVTATGLNLASFGHVQILVEGEQFIPSLAMLYKGTCLTGLPNLFFLTGYTNASWTLKLDITCRYLCRVINHLQSIRKRSFVVPPDPLITKKNLIDLRSSYVLRNKGGMPSQGDQNPWRLHQNFYADYFMIESRSVDDGVMRFTDNLKDNSFWLCNKTSDAEQTLMRNDNTKSRTGDCQMQ
jgi:monooxygenase